MQIEHTNHNCSCFLFSYSSHSCLLLDVPSQPHMEIAWKPHIMRISFCDSAEVCCNPRMSWHLSTTLTYIFYWTQHKAFVFLYWVLICLDMLTCLSEYEWVLCDISNVRLVAIPSMTKQAKTSIEGLVNLSLNLVYELVMWPISICQWIGAQQTFALFRVVRQVVKR
jgi:hypothetical protein